MGRLIDADKFINWLDCEHLRNPSEKCLSELNVKQMINSQPTAFDVDKVLERLEKLQLKSMKYLEFCAVDAYQNAIEIVKGGGQR